MMNSRNEEKIDAEITPGARAVSTRLIENRLLSDFASASVAGTVIAFTAFPAEGYKKHLQSGQKTRFQPYRGCGIFAVNIVPTTAIQLTTDSYLQSYMNKDATNFQKLVASFYCGVQGAAFATIVENCILKQQIDKIKPTTAILEMFKQNPLRPWKSFSMIAARDGIFTAYMLWGGGQSDEYFKHNASGTYAFIGRLGISALGTALSHPFDMVGTYMQKTDKKISIAQASTEIFKKYGYQGFYRGFLSRYVMFYTFGNIIPFVKNNIDAYIENPAAKNVSLTNTFSLLNSGVKTLFSCDPNTSPLPKAQPNIDYVDLTSFKK